MPSFQENKDLIEKHRDINIDHDWWACIFDNFVEKMHMVGIEVHNKGRIPDMPGNRFAVAKPEIFFSGFSSQGDGACFEGYVGNWGRFFETHESWFVGDSLKYAVRYVNEPHAASWRHSGRYYHENSLIFDIEVPPPDPDNPEDELETHICMALFNLFDYTEFETQVSDIVKEYCQELYSDLEDEYDHLTSDEAVWETIVANELDKEEENV